MGVALDEWVELVDREYLRDFVPAGGSAVKIAVADPEEVAAAMDAVAAAADERGYFVARVSAAETRIHMIDHVFHAVARGVEWERITDQYLRALLNANGILVGAEQPLRDLAGIAEANGRLRDDLYLEINRLIVNNVLRDYALCKEFRTAMAMLCRGCINPANVAPDEAAMIRQWLRGERCSLAALKRVQIYQRIGRHNARLLLASLTRWLRQVGYAGVALVINLSAVVTEYRVGEVPVRYTRNTLLDAYEVLRQFIDGIEETRHLLLAVVCTPGLVEDPKRSVANYAALQLRIVNEVRDRDRANPLNTLVRLDGAADEGGLTWTRRE
ncbi:MAG: DUF2791 family P-loop domain-containing protein [Armatimonadetes bacterium]|nr:DUF2791 family P-loop domain-containing protein [Armatimonadota bacterium]